MHHHFGFLAGQLNILEIVLELPDAVVPIVLTLSFLVT
jgi:hypothetical protein